MKIRLKVNVGTYVRGEPVSPGDVIEVTPEDAFRLAPFVTVLPPDEAGEPGDAVLNRDPEAENRDPSPKRSHHARK